MKVTITKYLNVRVGLPSLNAQCYQYLAPGSELEIDGMLYTGDKYDGNDQWYKDEAGNYYWSGGVQDDVAVENIQALQLKRPFKKYQGVPSIKSVLDHHKTSMNWWIEDFNIHKIWKDEQVIGQRVNIVILDTGYVMNHPLGSYDLLTGWNFDSNDNNYQDNHGHGSSVTSIINALHSDLVGISPGASVFIAKSSSHPQSVINTINQLSEIEDIDIISFSNSYEDNLDAKYRASFYKAINSNPNSIFVCAAGNDGKNKTKLFPAGFSNVLCVGAIDKQHDVIPISNYGKNVHLFAPGGNLKGLSKSGHFLNNLDGTSYSTPYISGLLALLIAKAKEVGKDFRQYDPVDSLLLTANKKIIESSTYNIINPLAAFNHFKNRLS